MSQHGWYQVAFERDLTEDLMPTSVGTRQLMIVRSRAGIRIFDAICPHRGANLAFGGQVQDDAIVCPFHGYRIGLGQPCENDFRVREYTTLVIGGLVLVRLSNTHENGLVSALEELDQSHYFVPGFALSVGTPAEMVIENAFDNSHFRTVHGIHNEPRFSILPSRHGEYMVEGVFATPMFDPREKQQSGAVQHIPFTAQAFSPGLVIGKFRGGDLYSIITAATPTPRGDCTVRLTLILPAALFGSPPDAEVCRRMMQEAKVALAKDRVIWENVSQSATPHFTVQDAAVLEFRRFCLRFDEREDAEGPEVRT